MPKQSDREREEVRRDCARKLRTVETSGTFTAIVGALLGEDWSSPAFAELQISPVYLLGRQLEGEAVLKVYRGTEEDLIRSIHGIAAAAQLELHEVGFLLDRIAELRVV